jgi:heptaprenyl diphosphate synthase
MADRAQQHAWLERVRAETQQRISATPLGPLLGEALTPLTSGKLLRSDVLTHVALLTGADPDICLHAASAIEILHVASLLHDDVIDGGRIRRGAPALWTPHGTKAAILAGDLLLSLAFEIIATNVPQATTRFARTLQDIVAAEMEQDLYFQKTKGSWQDWLRIAAGKTGSLFGFAAYCAASDDMQQAEALHKAGQYLGVAYQLADDLLDTRTDPTQAGKTLGTDAKSGKLSAADFSGPHHASGNKRIKQCLAASVAALEPWPDIQAGWQEYLQTRIRPLLHTITSG